MLTGSPKIPDLGEGLMLSGEIPVSTEILDAAPDGYLVSKTNKDNEVLLKAGLLLNDYSDIDEDHELAHFLLKQEVKLNLLIELVSELVASRSDFPAIREVCITPGGLITRNSSETGSEGSASYKEGDIVRIEIHLLPELPKALVFFAEITAISADKMCFEFFEMRQSVRDLLEKVLFRHHRRKIAQQKSMDQVS